MVSGGFHHFGWWIGATTPFTHHCILFHPWDFLSVFEIGFFRLHKNRETLKLPCVKEQMALRVLYRSLGTDDSLGVVLCVHLCICSDVMVFAMRCAPGGGWDTGHPLYAVQDIMQKEGQLVVIKAWQCAQKLNPVTLLEPVHPHSRK